MWFLVGAFETFDPFNDEVPDEPFNALPSIVRKAMDVVTRTLDERANLETLTAALEIADERIGRFFEIEAEVTHGDLACQDGFVNFGDVNPSNTSFLEALTEHLYPGESVSAGELGKIPASAVYAALAMFHVGEALEYIQYERSVSTRRTAGEPRLAKRPAIWYRTSAARELILAMEAACEATAAEYGEELDGERAREQDEIAAQIERLTATASDQAAAQRAREIISQSAKNAADQRHKENRAMKAQVFDWCRSELVKHKSMDSAAEAIAGKLVPVTFRTARTWIAEFRRSSLRAD